MGFLNFKIKDSRKYWVMGEILRPYSNEGRKRGLRIRMEVTHVSFGGHQSPPCNITEAHFSFFLVITLCPKAFFEGEIF